MTSFCRAWRPFFLMLAMPMLLAVSALPALAQQRLLGAQSQVGFVVKQMGVPVQGQFRKFDAQLNFDPSKPENARIAFTIDLPSASIGVPEVDAEMPKPVWFNTAKFPQARFVSSAVKRVAPGKFDVTGQLSIKGVTQAVSVPVELSQAGALTTAQGTVVVKRLAFRIGDEEWADTSMVADEVQVRFKLVLEGVAKL